MPHSRPVRHVVDSTTENPPPQFDHVALQAAIAAAVSAALTHISESGTNGTDSGIHLTNPGLPTDT